MPTSHDPDRRTVPATGAADTHSTPGPRVVAVAFWTAVLLPAVHVPLLALGPVTGERAPLVAALVVVNAIALAIGYPHRRDGA